MFALSHFPNILSGFISVLLSRISNTNKVIEQRHMTNFSNVSNQLGLNVKLVPKCDVVQLQPLNPV